MKLRAAISAITACLGISGKEPVPAAENPGAPSQPPERETDLIAALSRAHGQMRMLMSHILELAHQHNFAEGRRELNRFETLLTRHLLVENNGFFDTLKSHLPDYAGKIQRCQADLQGVTKELKLVAEVCGRESSWPVHTTAALERLFDRVEERFTYEERSLFPVYLAIGDNRDVMDKTQIFDRSLYARLKAH